MRGRASILVVMIFVAVNVSAQRKKTANVIPPVTPSNDTNYACCKKHNLPASKRLSNYPFNKAKNVMLVSYGNKFYRYEISPDGKDTTTLYSNGGVLPIENDTLCFSKLKEKKNFKSNHADAETQRRKKKSLSLTTSMPMPMPISKGTSKSKCHADAET